MFSQNIFFPKHILKSIQGRKKLFFQVIVRNYLCNVLFKFLIKIESTKRWEIKEETPQLTLLYCRRTVRSSHHKCIIKKAVHKNFAIFTGNTCVGVFSLKSCSSESLRLPISKNICKRLLFYFFNGSLLHGRKGLRSRLDCSFRFQVRVTGLDFCFSVGISRPEPSPDLRPKILGEYL